MATLFTFASIALGVWFQELRQHSQICELPISPVNGYVTAKCLTLHFSYCNRRLLFVARQFLGTMLGKLLQFFVFQEVQPAMKIYTKTGDQGQTSLCGGERVAKDHLRIEACGTLDELNATLGVVRSEIASLGPNAWGPDARKKDANLIDQLLAQIQNAIFDLGAEVASPEPAIRGTELLGLSQIETLEQAIDHWEEKLPALRAFILPGGCSTASQLHMARAVCRRSERGLVTLSRGATLRSEVMIYLNRLSDLLFVLARVTNQLAGYPDVPWTKSG